MHKGVVLRLHKAMHRLSYLPWALKMTWMAARKWTVAWAVLLMIQGLLPAATVYLTKFLVDSIVAAAAAGGSWAEVRPVLFYAILMALAMLATQVLQSVLGWLRTAQAELVGDYMRARVQEKASVVDLAFYETPAFFDRLYRVLSQASSRPLALLENLGGLLQNSITLLAMAAIILPYGVWLPVALLFSTLPAFWVICSPA